MPSAARALVLEGDVPDRAEPGLRLSGARQDERAAGRLTLRWLVRLRWAAIATQVALVCLGAWYGWLPVVLPLVALICAAAVSNAALAWARNVPRIAGSRLLLGSILVADVVLLTGMLTASGGPSNPFSVAYLVYVTLAAVTLGERWAWLVVVAAVGGYASLFLWYVPLSAETSHATGLTSHLAGMWLAFAASAGLIAFFIARVTRTLVERERELADLRQLAARHERLASLTTLAAGAAHELATPLASIAVAASELERAAHQQPAGAYLDDARLIRSQVERCRVILDRMSGRASQEWIERPSRVDLGGVLTPIREALGDRAVRLQVSGELTGSLVTSRAGLAQALLSVIRNAFDASPSDAEVLLRVDSHADCVVFEVSDSGTGIEPDVLDRLGDPFYTTKPPSAGYGLGLFLVRLFAAQHRGRLTIESAPGVGTRVSLTLPRDGPVDDHQPRSEPPIRALEGEGA
jgi:two-component system, sensor histidine kinase RegB